MKKQTKLIAGLGALALGGLLVATQVTGNSEDLQGRFQMTKESPNINLNNSSKNFQAITSKLSFKLKDFDPNETRQEVQNLKASSNETLGDTQELESNASSLSTAEDSPTIEVYLSLAEQDLSDQLKLRSEATSTNLKFEYSLSKLNKQIDGFAELMKDQEGTLKIYETKFTLAERELEAAQNALDIERGAYQKYWDDRDEAYGYYLDGHRIQNQMADRYQIFRETQCGQANNPDRCQLGFYLEDHWGPIYRELYQIEDRVMDEMQEAIEEYESAKADYEVAEAILELVTATTEEIQAEGRALAEQIVEQAVLWNENKKDVDQITKNIQATRQIQRAFETKLNGLKVDLEALQSFDTSNIGTQSEQTVQFPESASDFNNFLEEIETEAYEIYDQAHNAYLTASIPGLKTEGPSDYATYYNTTSELTDELMQFEELATEAFSYTESKASSATSVGSKAAWIQAKNNTSTLQLEISELAKNAQEFIDELDSL